MKKIFIPLIFLFLFLSIGYLQGQSFGLKIGYNSTDIHIVQHDDNFLTYKTTPIKTFLLGISADIPINNALSLETELLTIGKGASLEATFPFVNVKEYTDLTPFYITLPIALKVTGQIGEMTRLYVKAGPYIGLGVGGNIVKKTNPSGSTGISTRDIKWGSEKGSDLKSGDFGIVVGGGIEYGRFQLGLSYEMGLSDINMLSDDKGSNRVLSLTLAYNILQRKKI